MRRNALLALGAILLFALFLVVRNNWTDPAKPKPIDIMSQATELRYRALEIRDYQGFRLDPSIGPRDNSIKGIQTVDLASYSLKVSGLVEETQAYTYDEVLQKELHERLITLYCVEGWEATILWKGVRLMDLLDEAGLRAGAEIVIFHCHDGYTTSMPVETIRERDMLLAFSSNGIVLPESLGFPFMVVAQDKQGYKWARWEVGMEVSGDAGYRGYWEKRGYSNEAEVRR